MQSAERRRNMLSAQCAAALNQRQPVASGQTREKSRIEFPIFFCLLSLSFGVSSGPTGGAARGVPRQQLTRRKARMGIQRAIQQSLLAAALCGLVAGAAGQSAR